MMNRFKLDLYQILALVMVVVIAALISGGWLDSNSYARQQSDRAIGTVSVELAEDQNPGVGYFDDQIVARLLINTEEGEYAKISALRFGLRGSIRTNIIRNSGTQLLSVFRDGKELGRGEMWSYQDNQYQQVVRFDPPLIVNRGEPALLQVETSLRYRNGSTLGLTLIGVDSTSSVRGLPVVSPLYRVRTH